MKFFAADNEKNAGIFFKKTVDKAGKTVYYYDG